MITASDVFNAKILIVDDQDANVVLLEEMLRSAGYASVFSTKNPREVCQLYRENHYDLILLDLMMPSMDGFELIEGLKEIEAEGYIPVLVITVHPEHKLRALKAGAKDFVTKPFEIPEVLLRVYNMVEVRRLHLESKRLNDQLQAAYTELQAYSYSVSHDLRAPLRNVLNFVELLQENVGPSLSEENLNYLKTISQTSIRMQTLIDDLLAFSQLGSAELQKGDVDLNELVQDVLGDFQAETKKRNIAWKVDPLPVVRADRSLLRLALVNLLSNAVKFTGARADTRIEIGCAPTPNGDAVISIHDNGAGFDPQYSSKLFGVFQRLHSRQEFEGTGIGLASVQRIITRHGGRAWAEAVLDGGATFYFSIPKPMAA